MSKNNRLTRRKLLRLKDHPFLIPVLTFLLLFFITIGAFVSFSATTIGPADSRVVNLFIDGQSQSLPTRAKTVGDLLKRLDIQINEGDVVEPKVTTQILEDNFTVNVYRARPVTIIDGKKKITTLSAAQSSEGVARSVGIKLFPEDIVEVSTPENVIEEGVVAEKFVVSRSIPVTLVLFGKSYDIRTHAKTVGDLIVEKKLNPNDITVFPATSKKLKENDVVFVTSPGKIIVIKEESIPNKEETVEDSDLPLGQTKVKEAGKPGKKVVIYEIDKKNPKKRKALQTIVASKPVNKVIAKGSKIEAVKLTGSKAEWMQAAGIEPSQYQYVDYIIGRESGWNPGSVSPNRCIGLGQKCDAGSLIAACPSWQTDPVCQLNHFSGYANGRYGSWQEAWQFWNVNHWW